MDPVTVLMGITLVFLLVWGWRDKEKENEMERYNKAIREVFPGHPPQYKASAWDGFWEAVVIMVFLIFLILAAIGMGVVR